jgi:hypothetical protein
MDRSENIFKAEYTQPQIEFDSDDYLELFEDLRDIRDGYMSSGLYDERSRSGHIVLENTGVLFWRNEQSTLEFLNIQPDAIESSRLRFEYYDQSEPDQPAQESANIDTFSYAIYSTIMTPGSINSIPEAYHEQIKEALIECIEDYTDDDITIDGETFVDSVMAGREEYQNMIYQQASVEYGINPLYGELEHSVCIDYVIVMDNETWYTVNGPSYSSAENSDLTQKVHDRLMDGHALEAYSHKTPAPERERLETSEAYYADVDYFKIIDQETEIDGITSGITDEEHCKRIQQLLKRLPRFTNS